MGAFLCVRVKATLGTLSFLSGQEMIKESVMTGNLKWHTSWFTARYDEARASLTGLLPWAVGLSEQEGPLTLHQGAGDIPRGTVCAPHGPFDPIDSFGTIWFCSCVGFLTACLTESSHIRCAVKYLLTDLLLSAWEVWNPLLMEPFMFMYLLKRVAVSWMNWTKIGLIGKNRDLSA